MGLPVRNPPATEDLRPGGGSDLLGNPAYHNPFTHQPRCTNQTGSRNASGFIHEQQVERDTGGCSHHELFVFEKRLPVRAFRRRNSARFFWFPSRLTSSVSARYSSLMSPGMADSERSSSIRARAMSNALRTVSTCLCIDSPSDRVKNSKTLLGGSTTFYEDLVRDFSPLFIFYPFRPSMDATPQPSTLRDTLPVPKV